MDRTQLADCWRGSRPGWPKSFGGEPVDSFPRSTRCLTAGEHRAHRSTRCFKLPPIRKSCDHHGAAAQPSRRHRDPAVELRKGDGRGGFGLPLGRPQAPAASAPKKPCGRGHCFGRRAERHSAGFWRDQNAAALALSDRPHKPRCTCLLVEADPMLGCPIRTAERLSPSPPTPQSLCAEA